jgi:hypothetical protein
MPRRVNNRSIENNQCPIPLDLIPELDWWHDHITDSNLIFAEPVSHFLVADASNVGAGAVIDGNVYNVNWRDYQCDWHINDKEVFAVTHFMKRNLSFLANSTVHVQTDNVTAQAYLDKQGGTKNLRLYHRIRRFYNRLTAHNIRIQVHRIPTHFNGHADSLSRNKPLPEWHLLPAGVAQVTSVFGPISLDLFASRRAHIHPRYVSLDATDTAAVWTDAFSRSWSGENVWLFPPPFEIPRVLRHLQLHAHGTFLLLTPLWKKAFWHPHLLHLTPHPPLHLQNFPSVFLDCATGRAPAKTARTQFVVWRLRFSAACPAV